FAVHEQERETAERKPAHNSSRSYAGNRLANPGVAGDQTNRGRQVGQQRPAQPVASGFIPPDVVSKLLFGFVVRPYELHRPRMSLSIRARTSFQSEVPNVPASTAAHLLSI